jgi:hypothetical protein
MPPDRITNYDAIDAIFLRQAFNSFARKGRVVCGRSRVLSNPGLQGGNCNLCRQGKDDLKAANQEGFHLARPGRRILQMEGKVWRP